MNDKVDEYHSSKVLGWPYQDKLVKSASNATGQPAEPASNQQSFETYLKLSGDWLKDDHVNFVSLYLSEPGRSAEIFGPNSPQARHEQCT